MTEWQQVVSVLHIHCQSQITPTHSPIIPPTYTETDNRYHSCRYVLDYIGQFACQLLNVVELMPTRAPMQGSGQTSGFPLRGTA